MVKRHGYYLLATDSLHGDQLFALEAKAYFSWYELEKKYASKFDGCSIFEHEDGSIVRRIVLLDFFSTELKVKTQDLL